MPDLLESRPVDIHRRIRSIWSNHSVQKNNEPQVMISIGPVHLRRVTAWGVHCSQHGLVRDKLGHTKEAALANAQAHVKKGHIGRVGVRVGEPR